jgi:hypothetical protein
MTTSTIWYRMPAAVRIGAHAAIGLGAAALVAAIYYPAGPASHAVLVTAGVVGVMMVMAAVWGERLLRRDFGSAAQYVEFAGALRSGELPADIEPAVWRGWLARGRQYNVQRIGAVAPLVVFGIVPALRVPTTAHLIIAVVLAGLAVSTVVDWHIERRLIARLATAVEERAAGR